MTFKEEVRTSILPKMEEILQREEEHLAWLRSKRHGAQFVSEALERIESWKATIKQYKEYANLCDLEG